MFRKKKGAGDDQGYDRISRLIEDRRRELADGDAASEDIEADTIQLQGNGTLSELHDEDSISLLGVRGAHRAAADEEQSPTATSSLPGRWTGATSPGDEADETVRMSLPSALSQPHETEAAPAFDLYAVEREPAPMRVPDIATSTANVTLVAVDATWEGKLRSEGDVRIEGIVRGQVETAATLVIAPHAQVHASIRARNIMLAGDVEGDITCDERLEILPGGSARGQINSAKLVVHEGAYIDSRFQMRRDTAGGQQD